MLKLIVCLFIFILIFMSDLKIVHCLNVNFREFNAAKLEPFNTQIHKREMSQFFDKASFSFNGFEKIESVPVLFPSDICLLNLEGVKYATALHRNKNGELHFVVFKYSADSYIQLADIATPNATAMDCNSLGAKGYVAIAFNITTRIENAKQGSPIYEITGDRVRAVQYFATPNLSLVYLRTIAGNDELFMVLAFRNTEGTPNLQCPYYKWSGSTFTRQGRIPCSNAHHLEPFSIDYELYMAVANYADLRGRTSTYSEIYKYVKEKKSFQLFQKIKTHGAVDVRHFRVPVDEVKRQHFLIFGNSLNRTNNARGSSLETNREADSVFYVFDKGQFVPYQSLSLYAVERFLPIQNADAEKFLLLVACSNQDTKIYNLNDWKFEESETQFTEGALGKGVANMRIYQENDQSYLVIANELMMENDTNIFLPIFQQDEHANALRQQIMDWVKTNLERLTHVDVEKIRQRVEEKLSKHRNNNLHIQAQDIPTANIETVITNSFIHPNLHMTSNYWKALSYADQALDALQTEIASISHRKKRSVAPNDDYQFEEMHINTLLVRDKFVANRVNGISTQHPEFDSINAKRVIVTNNYEVPDNLTEKARLYENYPVETHVGEAENEDEMANNDVLQVEHLVITGKLNEYTWNELVNNTLKLEGLQFVKAAAYIGNLTAETLVVTSDEVSGENLGKLVSINEGNYVIDQVVTFEEPVIAANVVINERLNDIHIRDGKLDVLMKKANETQFIKGKKVLENLRMLEPITMAGQERGDQLQSMTPHRVIHENLILNGDYTINGNIIASEISSSDIIVPLANISVSNTLQNAVNVHAPLENVNIKFTQPLEANNSLVSFVNAQNMQHLIKTNVNHIQLIQGRKIFKNTLQIQKGFSEVKFLNNIDVEALGNRLLLNKANQTINVPMHFGTIVAQSVQSPNLTLNQHRLDDYLTKSSSQHIPATLTAHQIHAKNIDVSHLQVQGRIFEHNPADLYQQKAREAPIKTDILQEHRKFPGTIFVRNLLTNASLNGKHVNDIEQSLRQLNGDIRFMGDYKFNYAMNITHLTFQGKLNGITAAELGRTWLQKTGAQTFSAPQTLSAVTCDKGVFLEGTLNGYKHEDFYTHAVWINRDEHLGACMFENPIQIQGPLITSTLNGLHVPLDMLYQHAKQPQILYASNFLSQDLNVAGGIFNITHVNGINLAALERFLSGYGYETLHVEHVNFLQPPYYQTLNHYDTQSLLDAVWLANENVNIEGHVEIAQASFQGLLEFQGLINNMNLNYLKEHYFSLSRPQQVNTELIFINDVIFLSKLHANELKALGTIIESTSNNAFTFNEFVSNTLKTNGPHEIRAAWSILEAIVQGDLQRIQINNLNLAQDVLHTNRPFQQITAPKRFHGAIIKKLYATPTSRVNGVPVADWIRETVFVYENHTIQGITTLNTVNMYADLRVHGLVNNLTFGEQTLLLRDLPQTVKGNVRIHNIFPDEQRILVNNFDNLNVTQVNGRNVAPFLANRARLASSVTVEGNLVFLQPLVVHEYHNLMMDGVTNTKRHIVDTTNSSETVKNLIELWDDIQTLQRALETPYFNLDHFEIQQTLEISAEKMVHLLLYEGNSSFDIIAILSTNEIDPIQYYEWSDKDQKFIIKDGKFFGNC